jgi:glycosyltransferase involved in cell wall biosynthesis
VHILIQQFLTQNHSWAIVGQNLARAFLSLSHSIDLIPTDKDHFFPPDLLPYKKEKPTEKKIIVKGRSVGHSISLANQINETRFDYDAQISYTAPLNFPHHLSHGSKNRFAIWNYETTVIPFYFLKYFSFPDYILPSSQFSKDIFLRNNIPEEKMVVVPHGIDYDHLNSAQPLNLKTKKTFKIAANIAQVHVRKNLSGLLLAFGRAFKKEDDVCLVLKISLKEPKLPHEQSFKNIFSEFKKKFPHHAEIEIIHEFIPNIGSLYQVCDLIYSLPHTECFWLPGLEGAACGKPSVVSRYGGQLDYLNDENSYLISGKMIQAPANAQYWSPSPKAEMFEPDINQATDILRQIYNNQSELKTKENDLRQMAQKYTWKSAAQQILTLTK